MAIPNLDALAELIRRKKESLLARWRAQVRELPSAKDLDTPTLNDHVPALLDELATAFERASDKTIPAALLEGSPPTHGLQRQKDGFDIVEVVAEYNILRGCIHDLAEGAGLSLEGQAFHILNRIFDEAIGLAVQTFAAQQALEVLNRREEYLAFVAHDLRTPLNAISLSGRFLEQVFTGGDVSPDADRMFKTLHRNVKQLELLVGKVLKETEHVQSETGVKLERREFDLWPLVQRLIQDLHPVAGTTSAELINEIPEELVAWADASVLRRIFQNLVANAILYTPRGEIRIGARDAGPAGGIECWVSDNGIGIPADRLDKIFEKLETDPQQEGGTGLGLAIVKSFVEAHGGEVFVESSEGVGSVFTFTLPGRAKEAGG
jgi:two-component system phosphate regulon sensor histidine kinase PhoR